MSASVGAPSAAPCLAGVEVAALRGVRLPDGTLGEVRFSGGSVAATPGPGLSLDASGWRVLPAACEPHAHLDKALTAPRMDPGAGNDLPTAIAQWRSILPGIDRADIESRALAAVGRYLANGITAIRSHVDVPLEGDRFRGVDALVGLRERLRGTVDLQVCLLAGSEADDGVVAEAVARGVDVVGGCPHLAPDPRHEITRMLDVAQAHDLPVDLHADEQTDVGHALDLEEMARQVLARGMRQRVTASHCVRLGMLPPDRLAQVLDLTARAGIGIVTLPITNLYLQGRGIPGNPRGLAPLPAILAAGVPLAAGADNLRDPFNPAGRADPFETTSLLQTAGHLRAGEALHAVTGGARAVLGLPAAGVGPGERADLLLVPDTEPGDLLAGAPEARIVLAGGRVVADSRVARQVHLSPSELPEVVA
ncbi:amidohydrolase family protein [Pseudonocardia sp. WMMC193]|uniref:amidohydrolase family protein n=1 Tax=Pseudonocardia sp. WMMC193 TaxID=2911965 RepID=UPI001F2BCCFE|nr:amidohydrolase family protein [Pseudonocardia sp. WMMC193]MCF7548832.1 amidohydrolase family protein [Pseudonocardia sp. WMMC193]